MTAPWVSVESFYRSGDRDDTASFARALERHTHVEVPARHRPYELRATDHLDRFGGIRYGVLIPSGRTIKGIARGQRPVVRTILPDASRLERADYEYDPNVVSWLATQVEGDSLTIENVAFQGESPRVTPANWRLNLQMGVVLLLGTRHVSIRGCHFERQWGFTVHQPGKGTAIEYVDNTHVDCMNGVNINGDHLLTQRTSFVRSEGYECSGSYQWHLDNDFSETIQAYSIGGDGTPSPGKPHATTVVIRRSTVDGVVWMHGKPQPSAAIHIADNVGDVWIDENLIERAAGNGIAIAPVDNPRTFPVQNVRVTRNTFRGVGAIQDAGRANHNDRYPIYIDGADDVEVQGNTIEDLPGYAAHAGVLARAGRGRGLKLGPNDIRVAARRYAILGNYERLEWLDGERP